MPDLSPVPSTLPALAPLLITAFTAGTLTQLTRLLTRTGRLRARPTAARAAAAGIAALTVAALLSATLTHPSPALLLALACVTGWTGPSILARLGSLVERQLDLRPDAPGPHPGETDL